VADQEPGRKIIRPQFLMGQSTYQKENKPKIVFRTISNATNERSLITSTIPGMPAGNSLGVLESEKDGLIALAANLSVFVFDYLLRLRMTGTNVNWFILSELPVVKPAFIYGISKLAEVLTVNHICFAPYSDFPPSAWLTNPESRAELAPSSTPV
jgi:hypothetical protein